MRHLLNEILGTLMIGVVILISVGLLLAAAVVGFANVIGAAGALAVVGGALLVSALAMLLLIQSRQRRSASRRQKAGADVGGLVAAFLLGVWDGLSQRPRD